MAPILSVAVNVKSVIQGLTWGGTIHIGKQDSSGVFESKLALILVG